MGSSPSKRQKAAKQQLHFDEKVEELNVTIIKRNACCNKCLYNDFVESTSRMRSVRKVESAYICYGCELYLCEECVNGHENHEICVHKESGERERMGLDLINSLRRERRVGNLTEENVCMYDRVNVKHAFDKKHCFIKGLCGLNNRRWVACDQNNCCIKIFECGSNVLLRYIRIGSGPFDASEIHVKQNSAVSNLSSTSDSGISVAHYTKPERQFLLAVTVPEKRHILFIDNNKTPAIRKQCIKMKKKCYGIDFCEDKIFTLCNEDPSLKEYPWSVYVMSSYGDQLSVLETDICVGFPDLAVAPGRVYMTDEKNNKVYCKYVDGRIISEIIKNEPLLKGISVDPNHNVYISAWRQNQIFQLDSGLVGPQRPLFLHQSTYIEGPDYLCFYQNKLFVSHRSYQTNIVSVVSLV